jgi:hypothetical protein
MNIFPYDNIVIGILIFIVGFIFHWLGQLVSLINWDYAKKIGLQEEKNLPEYEVYEQAIATSDVLIGWLYGIVAVGLLFNASWAYTLAWIPGVVFIYHSLFYWVMKGNQNKSGHPTTSNPMRITWFLLNSVSGILSILLAL